MGMNSRDRAIWYPKVVQKQHGEYCRGCGKAISKPYTSVLPLWICSCLYIDHMDNSPNHTVIENLQLLCPSCNRIKNPKKKEFIPERPFTPEMAKNTKYEEPWRRWINNQILEDGGILVSEAINGGAERFGLSPETTRKYFLKVSSDQGNFGLFEDKLVFKKDIPILEEEKQRIEDERDGIRKSVVDYSKSKSDV